MNRSIENIFDFIEGEIPEYKKQEFKQELQQDKNFRKEFNLILQIDEFLQSKFDLEEVLNDPDLSNARDLADVMLADYHYNPLKYSKNQLFVKNSLVDNDDAIELRNKLNQIKREIDRKGLVNAPSSNSAQENKSSIANRDKIFEGEDVRNFVMDALESNEHKIIEKEENKHIINARITKIISFSAAAAVALFFIMRALVYAPDSDSTYKEFYNPIKAFSPITRELNQKTNLEYNNALELYKQRIYKSAFLKFFELYISDPNWVAPRFYMGLSQLELNDNMLAIDQLTWVVAQHRDFYKEAQWYLGLAYIRNNQIPKAIQCFQILEETGGYYQTQARAILKRIR